VKGSGKMGKGMKILMVVVAILMAAAVSRAYMNNQKKEMIKKEYEARIAAENEAKRQEEVKKEMLRLKSEKEESELLERAKEAVRNMMKDPDSVKFKDLIAGQVSKDKKKHVCGMVNSKNSMGGYVGYKGFVYIDGEKYAVLQEDGIGNEVFDLACNKK
jgi:glutamyl/glutaminyl-tRNA synthetase